jgi:hypothetical protein
VRIRYSVENKYIVNAIGVENIMSRQRVPSFVIILRTLAVVLFISGALKALHLHTSWTRGTYENWTEAGFALLELSFAAWLVIGMYPRFSWWLSVALFLVLLVISFDKGAAGQQSCGCFGPLEVHPWYAFTFDLGVIVVLLTVHPLGWQSSSYRYPRKNWVCLAVLNFVIVTVLGLVVTDRENPNRSTDINSDIFFSSSEPLQPTDWVGKIFPLKEYLDFGPDLSRGRWAVMFFKDNCALCRQGVPQFLGLAYQQVNQTGTTRYTLVEVPDEAHSVGTILSPSNTFCVRGRLTASHEWRMELPAYILLEDGRVTFATHEHSLLSKALSGAEDYSAADHTFLFPPYREIRRKMFLREIACGPLALLAICEQLGVQVSQTDINAILEEAGQNGIEMLRLKELARKHGLHALGVSTSTEKLKQMRQPAIAYLEGTGFVAVTGYSKEGVIVVYPLTSPGFLPDDLFAKAFGDPGRALLLSRSALNAETLGIAAPESREAPLNKPRLRLSRSQISIGRIHQKQWEGSLALSNEGTAPLVISEISTNCPCFKAWADASSIPPGQSTTLHAKTTQQMQIGSFAYSIRLNSNDPKTPAAVIPVRGYIEHIVGFRQPTVLARGLLPHQRLEVKVGIDVPSGVDIASLTATVVPPDGRLTAKLNRESNDVSIAITWHGTDQLGWHRYHAHVTIGTNTNSIGSALPCAVEVVPVTEVFPASLLLDSSLTEDQWSRRIMVRSKTHIPDGIHISCSDEELQKTIIAKTTRLDGNTCAIDIQGKTAPLRRGHLTNVTLTLALGGEPTISMPVYVYSK